MMQLDVTGATTYGTRLCKRSITGTLGTIICNIISLLLPALKSSETIIFTDKAKADKCLFALKAVSPYLIHSRRKQVLDIWSQIQIQYIERGE